MKIKSEKAGMSFGGFVYSVNEALMKKSNLDDVEVRLSPMGKIITISKYIISSRFQEQLSNTVHYSIMELWRNYLPQS